MTVSGQVIRSNLENGYPGGGGLSPPVARMAAR